MSASRKKLKLNVLTFALMLREFQSGPTSSKDIVEITGYQRHTVTNYLRVLHDKGCIHIVGYEEDAFGRQRGPVYALGAGRDVPKIGRAHV